MKCASTLGNGPIRFAKSIYKNIAFHMNAGVKDKKILGRIELKLLNRQLYGIQVKDDLHKSALTLSGGQQQRLCIARATSVSQISYSWMSLPARSIATAQLEETMLELKKEYRHCHRDPACSQTARASDYTGFFYTRASSVR